MGNKWLNNAIISNTSMMNGQAILSYQNINDLANDELTADLESLFIGEYTKWASSLIAYPIDLTRAKVAGTLKYKNKVSNIPTYSTANIDSMGYYLGQYHFRPYDFLKPSYIDYEPYTQLKIYLPYYGWVDIPINDVLNKYIQFRLMVDFQTGSAQYILGVNDSSVSCPHPPYVIDVNDNKTRVISTYNFQLGTVIPIGTSGTTENVRNAILGAVKLAGSLAVGAWNVAAGAGIATSTSVTSPTKTTLSDRARNPKTGRMIDVTSIEERTSEKRTTTATNYSNRIRANIRSEAFSNSMSVLSNIQYSAASDKSNNTNLNDYISRDIRILIKRSKVKTADANYAHLYGFPLGEPTALSSITGYTEISSVRIAGEQFNLATQEELSMLNEIITAGIIL